MKNRIKYLILMMSVCGISGEALILDEAIQNFTQKSKLAKVSNISKELSDRKTKQERLNRIITATLSPSITFAYWPWYTGTDNPYTFFSLSPTINFFDLTLSASFSFNRDKTTLTSRIPDANIQASFNDLIYYSKSRYSYNTALLEKEKNDILISTEEIKNIELLINEYVEIINNQDYVLTLSDNLEELEKTNSNLALRQSEGSVAELDVESMNMEIIKLKKDIKATKDKLELLKEKFCDKVGIVYASDIAFEAIENREIDSIVIDNGELLAKKVELKELDEKLYYSYRTLQPEVGIALGFDTYDSTQAKELKERSYIGLFLSWEPLRYLSMTEKPYDIKQEREKLSAEVDMLAEQLSNSKKELENRHQELLKEIRVAQDEVRLWRKRVAVKRTMYETGMTDIVDYLKYRNNLKKSEKNLNEQKNELYGLKYRASFISSLKHS